MKVYSSYTLHFIALFLLFANPLLGFSKTIHVDSSSSLTSALKQAQEGDEIIVASGVYTGTFSINENSGSPLKPITLRAEKRHTAILKGSGNFADTKNVGLTITRSHWIVEGFTITDHLIGILIQKASAHHIDVRHNVIQNFGARGIEINASSHDTIHHNVVAFSPAPGNYSTYAGVAIGNNGQHNWIEHNIIYSITNGGHQCGDAGGCTVGAKQGYGIQVRESSNNTVRGNLVMDSAKATIRIFSSAEDEHPTNYNRAEGNIIAFSEGGAVSASDDTSSYNTIANNFIYDVYYAAWSGKGNKPGFNTYQHNTTIVTPFSRLGAMLNHKDGVASQQSTVKDNLFYSAHVDNGSQYLWRVDDWSEAVKESHHNLFWRLGDTAKWTNGVTFDLTDIREQPQFVDPLHGDFSLAPNSPGKGASSNGKDIGIEFNEFLKKQWAKNIFALPTQEKSTAGAIISFPTSSAHQYQVYVYIPETTSYRDIETFSIEDSIVKRDYKNIISGGWVGATPQRWIYLGTHRNNGQLDVRWTQADTASKIFIRQLPTPYEAYSWISSAEITMPLEAPSNLEVLVDGMTKP